jgi:hypothetical protein
MQVVVADLWSHQHFFSFIITIIIIGSTVLGDPGLLEKFCPFVSVEGHFLPATDP